MLPPPERHAPQNENRASVLPERVSSIGELINILLRAGYSMTQIRAMYPGLFSSPNLGD